MEPVTSDDQVRAYIKKIMSQLNKWMIGQKISKLVIVITGKESGEHVERWQFDVRTLWQSLVHANRSYRYNSTKHPNLNLCRVPTRKTQLQSKLHPLCSFFLKLTSPLQWQIYISSKWNSHRGADSSASSGSIPPDHGIGYFLTGTNWTMHI